VRQLVIDNPVINSAFLEPGKHFKFTDVGITDEIVESRRPSAYFIPVTQPKMKGRQLELGTEGTDDRRRENDYINEVRAAVGDWRRRDYPGVMRTTRRLLEYWQRRDRDRRLFFCQIEAAETATYLTECAARSGKQYLTNRQWGGVRRRETGRELDGRPWDERPHDPEQLGFERIEALV